jgi:hypothetical protein
MGDEDFRTRTECLIGAASLQRAYRRGKFIEAIAASRKEYKLSGATPIRSVHMRSQSGK